jgi:hypothetical protein
MKMTIYHSYDWMCLVEQGWITALIDVWPANINGPAVPWATMVRANGAKGTKLSLTNGAYL